MNEFANGHHFDYGKPDENGLYHDSVTQRTASGRLIDLLHPDPEDIILEDIANGLYFENRWGGATWRRINVATHSVLVMLFARQYTSRYEPCERPLLDLYALLHDAHEAYCKDIPRPLKSYLGAPYRNICDKLQAAIYRALHIPPPSANSWLMSAVHLADDQAAIYESLHYTNGPHFGEGGMWQPEGISIFMDEPGSISVGKFVKVVRELLAEVVQLPGTTFAGDPSEVIAANHAAAEGFGQSGGAENFQQKFLKKL